MTRALLGMSDHLASLGMTRVVMEATSDYWKPVFYLLEAAGFETWLVNAKDVKHLPGRPNTDKHGGEAAGGEAAGGRTDQAQRRRL
jgi:transposase